MVNLKERIEEILYRYRTSIMSPNTSIDLGELFEEELEISYREGYEAGAKRQRARTKAGKKAAETRKSRKTPAKEASN